MCLGVLQRCTAGCRVVSPQVDGGAPGVPPPQGNFGTLSPYGMTQPEYGVDGIDYRAQMAAFAQHTAPADLVTDVCPPPCVLVT